MKDNSDLYSNIFKTVPNGIVVLKPIKNDVKEIESFEIIALNNSFEKICSVSANLLIGKMMHDLGIIPSSELSRWNCTLKNSLLNKSEVNYEYFSNRLNRWFAVRACCMGDDLITAVFNDITLHKETHQKFNALLKSIDDIVFEIDKDYRYCNVWTNNEVGLFIPKEEFIGRTIYDIFELDYAKKFISVIEHVFSTKQTTVVEYSSPFVDDERFYTARISPIMLTENVCDRVVISVRDITSEKQTKKELKHMLALSELVEDKMKSLNKLYKLIVETATLLVQSTYEEIGNSIFNTLSQLGHYTSADKVYIVEFEKSYNNYKITYYWANKGLKSIENTTEVISNLIMPVLIKKLKQNEYVYIPDIDNLDKEYKDENIIRDNYNLKSMLIIPLFYDSQLKGFIGFETETRESNWEDQHLTLLKIFGEIISGTIRRRVDEAKLNKAKKDAEDANKSKDEFLANISHEIRTPLNAILGFSEILMNKITDKRYLEDLSVIKSSGKSLLSIISDILDLSKIEAGKLKIENTPVSMISLLKEIERIFMVEVEKKKLNLSIDINSSIPEFLLLDEIRIRQVLFNIVGNAVKFTNKGFIKIHVLCNEIVGSGKVDLLIIIEDSGVGISKAQQELVFNAFHQQHGASNRKYGGTGLGLAISRKLVEKMNGNLTVESEEHVGSKFTISLPDLVISQNFSNKTKSNEIDRVIYNAANVLIIEQDKSTTKTIKKLLKNSPLLRYFVATTKSEAESILQEKTLNLVIFDAEIEGIEEEFLVDLIKKSNSNDVPVLVLSGDNNLNVKTECSISEKCGIIYKPIAVNQLQYALNRHLDHIIIHNEDNVESYNLEDSDETFNIIIDKSEIEELLKKIEVEVFPIWSTIKNRLIIYEIENFATKLKSVVNQYSYEPLQLYANALSENIVSFNIDGIEKLMERFPNELMRLKSQLIKESKN